MKIQPAWWLLLACFVSALSAAPCGSENVGHTYAPCVGNKRTAVFYWIVPCEPSDFPLPTPHYDLPCDIQCEGGSYLPFGDTICSPCDAGEYSIGGGEIISQWDTIPEGMSADCTGDHCQNWQMNGTFTSSGNNRNTINTVMNLRLFAHFIRPTGNMIQFSYIVDAESCNNCDGMIFYIDDVAMTPLISHQLQWKTATFNVSQGYHDFTWSYKKDYSISSGNDMAMINFIHLVGTSFADEVCSNCPHGTYSPEAGSPSCTPCPYNHYNPSVGVSACQPCDDHKASLQGATSCYDLPKCESKHVFYIRTACSVPSLTQDLLPQFVRLANGNVRACDETLPDSIALPPAKLGQPCYCPPGQYLKSNGVCDFCPDGQARWNETSCFSCPEGTAAMKALYLTDWSSIPDGVETSCQGECDSQGWIPRGEHIDTGYGNGRALQSFLTIPSFSLEMEGTLEFTYSLASCGLSCNLNLIINNDQAEEVETVVIYPATQTTFKKTLAPGNYVITFRYTQTNMLSDSTTKLKLYSVVVTGVTHGGAPQCVPCPPGTEASVAGASTCTPCSPGFYSDAPGKRCKLADPGYFVDTPGASAQIPCGENTQSNPTYTDCETDCTFAYPGAGIKTFYYNLSALYNPEVMNFAGTDSNAHQYFLNLCSRVHQNSTCFDSQGNPIPTFGCQQVSGWGYAADIGRIIGFTHAEDPYEGLTVWLTQGSLGCANSHGGTSVPRKTKISMVCDLNAGIGSPKPAYNNTVEYPPRSCEYHFIWHSVYACPKCDIEDYEISVSDCINGKKFRTHVKKSACWDPNPIPPEEISCTSCPTHVGVICGGHGTCDDTTGTCHCEARWSGNVCMDCNVGRFGPRCENDCPGGSSLPCSGHGICNSGVQGDGICSCSTGWYGEACSECAEGYEGLNCKPIPATVADVIPWWGFVLLFGGLATIVVIVVVLWRQKRRAEYQYTSLLRNQPVEMDDDNVIGIPEDEEEDAVERTL